MRPSGAIVVSGVVALGACFVYGFVVAEKQVFPYQQLRGLWRRVAPSQEQPSEPAVEPRMETGWWYPVRRPDGPSREDIMRDLDALGYMQSYHAADDEYGVTHYDRERSQPGHNLIVSAHEPTVLLADMEGQVLHSWSYAFEDVPVPDGYEPPGIWGSRFFRRARLLENGDLIALYERTGLIKLDKDSRLIWGLAGFYHHDFDVTDDGTIHVLTHEVRVIPRIHETRETFEDFITRVSPDGEVLDRFSLLEAFERSPYASFLENVDPDRKDIFHTNTIEVLDGELARLSPHFRRGMVLVSIWGLDVIAIVDPELREVVWAISGMWHRQHEPVLLENGNMLLFDNLGHRGRSKVIEFEPFTQRIVWSFEGDAENDFYSELCGSCQRLTNGNTLVTESLSGRAFEVGPDGEIVWRYLSPFRAGPEGEGVAVLMEVIRLEPQFPLDWLR